MLVVKMGYIVCLDQELQLEFSGRKKLPDLNVQQGFEGGRGARQLGRKNTGGFGLCDLLWKCALD